MTGHALAEELHVRVMTRPRTFVPAPAFDLFALRRLRRARNDTIDDLGFGGCADKIHALERRAKLSEVHVRIYETRQNCRALQIAHDRIWSAKWLGPGAIARKHD